MRVAAWLRSHSVAHLFVLQIASILTFDYWARIEVPHHQERWEMHARIVRRSAPYEFRYRVAVPLAAEAISRALPAPPQIRFALAYMFLNWIALLILLGGIYHLIRESSGPLAGLFGITLAGFLAAFTFRNHFFQPWSFWEAAQFAAGVLLIRRRAHWPLLLLCVAGAANRETSVILPLAFLLTTLPNVRSPAFRFAVAALLLWGVAFLGVRAAVGDHPRTLTLSSILELNLQHAGYAVILNLLLFGPVWPMLIRAVFGAPAPARRLALAMAGYVLLLLVVGAWWEIRYWMTALPVLVPALVVSVARQMPAEASSARVAAGAG